MQYSSISVSEHTDSSTRPQWQVPFRWKRQGFLLDLERGEQGQCLMSKVTVAKGTEFPLKVLFLLCKSERYLYFVYPILVETW